LTFHRSSDLWELIVWLACASVFFGVVGARPGADFLFGPFYLKRCRRSIFGLKRGPGSRAVCEHGNAPQPEAPSATPQKGRRHRRPRCRALTSCACAPYAPLPSLAHRMDARLRGHDGAVFGGIRRLMANPSLAELPAPGIRRVRSSPRRRRDRSEAKPGGARSPPAGRRGAQMQPRQPHVLPPSPLLHAKLRLVNCGKVTSATH
jgi:hypothetical protein